MPIELMMMLAAPERFVATFRDGELYLMPHVIAGAGTDGDAEAPAKAA